MDPFTLINKYYTEGSPLYDILVTHSRRVAEKAVAIARQHPDLKPTKLSSTKQPCFTT